ncbi:AfsR/SARP family transcriptional regulator [Winogradskya humida]|uniref:AfsR/SARP family transcriptional regulator n=1 Tax=Winogradskya humida TaxID=113566 RepID=UPI0019403E95|nr:BTAD domain-containing putative transcriptional regulator [Actinoplanes humidus]
MTQTLLPGPKVYFGLFGGVRAWRNQRPLELGPPQRRALLGILLAADGRLVTVAELIDLIWGERPSASATNLVHRHVGALRRTFEPELPHRAEGRWLVRSGSGYEVRVDAVSCDLRRFRLLAERAAQPGTSPATVADLLLQALDLASGAPGEGLTFPLAQATPFRVVERERVGAAMAAADAALRCGRERQVTPHLMALSARHPLDEPLHARLIDCLAAGGERAGALAVYEDVRRRLNTELGIEPGHELGDARRRVAGRSPAAGRPTTLAVAVPAQLPPAPTVFLGRERELAAADAYLARFAAPDDRARAAEDRRRPGEDGERAAEDRRRAGEGGERAAGHRICAITGVAGIGKTALALHWAHRNAGKFPDGQFYIDLWGDDGEGAAPAQVLRGFLTALGMRPAAGADQESLAAAFHQAVRGRKLLFVLDGARGSVQVRAVLPADPGCLVIATSRHCLTGLIAHEGAQPIPLETTLSPVPV